MNVKDQMLARLSAELEERQAFIDGVIETAEKDGRDLSGQEMELVTRAQERLGELDKQIGPMKEAAEIAARSRQTIGELNTLLNGSNKPAPREVEYRSAGEYLCDRWAAAVGQREAAERVELYHRAAAHQTTGDNPGLMPAPIIAPVVNFIDASRPLVSFLGPRQLPGKTWSRPKVTQHTAVAAQSAEKAELTSQKMVIGSVTGTAVTLGGYVNVSRQDIDWSQPGIMDIIIQDLAAQYAVLTEANAFTTVDAASTAGSTLPTGGTITADNLSAALWDAASKIYTATKGAGRFAAFAPPAMLGMIGPSFPPVPAVPSQSPGGFSASDFSTGLVGQVSGIPIYVSNGVGTNRILVVSTAGAEVYEDRIGSLSVTEPSVLGVQVAYAGYFTPLVVEATAIIKITKTP